MKTIPKIVYLVLFINSISFAQTINFDRDYAQFGNESEGWMVQQTNEGEYFIAGKADTNLFIMKTDSLGEIIFARIYEQSNEYRIFRTLPIEITKDGGVLFTTGISNALGSELFITKLDSDGNTIWENTYPDSQSVFGSDILETPEGDIWAIGYISSKKVKVINLTSAGEVIRSMYYDLGRIASFNFGPTITCLNDSAFLITNISSAMKIKANGETLWNLNNWLNISTVKSIEKDKIIIAGRTKLSKIDAEGNIEWSRNLEDGITSIDTTTDGGYIFVYGETLSKTDSLGTIQWQKIVYGNCRYIYSTLDSGFVITGRHNEGTRILKTDSEGEYKAVIIYIPYSSVVMPAYNLFSIWWVSNGLENLNIQYSVDGGASWINIILNYPADSNHYDWYVPNTVSDNCYLKISSSDDPAIYDITGNSFTIMHIQNYDYISVNECFMWIGNDGMGSHNPISDDSGFYWPGGENAKIPSIFNDGLVWGGKVNGEIKVNGNTYRAGLQPGVILPNGMTDNPEQTKYKIFKITKGWESLPESPTKDRLIYDYENWPGELGAPFNDINGDGIFTKGIDTPKFIGDEVLFYVANDMDTTKSRFTYGSDPIGLEFQTTVWGFDTDDFLKDAIFKKYKIINKSENTIEEMYFSYWTDDDMGFAGDDFVGCDTNLSLGYTYNGDNDDEDGYGINPPAVGHMLLEISNSGHLNITSKNLSSFLDTDKHFRTPTVANLGTYEGGTLEYYNLMQGLDNFGEPIIDPNTGDTTKFMVAGDPLEKNGWYAGDGWPDGPSAKDKMYTMTAGPFNMDPGDTIEVVFAIFMARGSSNIQSVTELRKTARALHQFWGNDIEVSVERSTDVLPNQFSLSQNYPNPFNPTTTIKYSIPSSSVMLNSFQHLNNSEIPNPSLPDGRQVRDDNANVELTVYDILGRKVKTLVNQKQAPGNYELEFNAIKLASGMYFYRLKVSDNVAVKKMMLLK